MKYNTKDCFIVLESSPCAKGLYRMCGNPIVPLVASHFVPLVTVVLPRLLNHSMCLFYHLIFSVKLILMAFIYEKCSF